MALPEILDPMRLLTNSWLKDAVLPAILGLVFIETGLLFPILPGDSLLFVGGLLAHTTGHPPLWSLLICVPVVAFLGDQCSYWIGRAIGPALFNKQDSRFFKQAYVTETHAFFEKHGPKTIILARFVPIVRTFMPVLAGVSKMDYRKFVAFDIVGAIAWGMGVTMIGYVLSSSKFVQKNIDAIFVLIVLISILPGIIQFAKRHLASRNTPANPQIPADR